MSEELRNQVGESLWGLASAVGTPLIGADEITVVPAGGMRRTYRLRFADGSTLKGRCFRTASRAEIVWRILVGPAAFCFGRAISHDGEAMLEEWVDGATLVQGTVAPSLVREAGRMLGRLHGCPLPRFDDVDFQPLDAAGWLEKTEANLSALTGRGLLTAARARHLRELAASQRPAIAPLGIVHRDLCPENLIVDARGRLRSIDSGSATVGVIDEDLCRVWYRWPMTPEERALFVEGYQEERGSADIREPSTFWAIVVLVNSARARLGLSTAAAEAVLQQLDRS